MSIINLNYIKNPHQKEFHRDTYSKFLHLSSGFGGGKTYGLIMKAFQLSWLNRHKAGGLVCPSFADYKKDVMPLLEEILDLNKIRYQHHKTEHWFKFPWSAGKLYVATAEKKLRGPNWAYAVINEVTLMSEERYNEVVGRVRIKAAPSPQIASVGTPEGTGHWLFNKFIENPMDNSRVIYGDTRDNSANLQADYIKSMESSFDTVMLDAYLKGLWVNMATNRFYYAYDPNKNDNKNIKQIEYGTVHASLDFNVAKMCCNLWHYDGKKLQAFDSIILKGNADTHKMAEALIKNGYTPDMTIIYPDPAGNHRSTKGKPDIQILRDYGFYQIKVKNSQPRMRTRQLNVNNLLDKGVIEIHPENCKDLKKDLEMVEQDPSTLEKVKKNQELTHSSDGLDYMCDILFPFSGNKTNSRTVKFR